MSTYYAKQPPRKLPDAFRKAAVSTAELWRQSILSVPLPDLAGDIVEPEGLDFSEHRLDPSLDLEHGRQREIRTMPVAWARKSLSRPGDYEAPYTRELDFAEDGAKPNVLKAVIGKEYFDPGCRVSMQVFALCEQELLPARSLEFRAVQGFHKALGQSPLENRPAYHFQKAAVVRWTICAQGVCPQAMQILKSLPQQVPPALGKILQDRRVNVGGTWEPLHGAILKALLPYRPHPDRTTVRVERKAMDDDTPLDSDITPAVEEETQPEAPASNGVTALLAHAQAMAAACDQLEQDLDNTDNPQLYKAGMALCEQCRKLATKVSETADKHDGMIQAAKGNGGNAEPEEEPDGDEENSSLEGYEPDDGEVEKALRRDSEGVLVHVPRPVYRKALQVKRFSLSEVARAAEQKPAASQLSAEEVTQLKAALSDLKKQLKFGR